MAESNNNFEEYEFDDELDDPWDDVLDDEIPHEDNIDLKTEEKHQGSSRAKPKSILKPILSLALLGGISFAAYSSFMPFPEKTPIPIIKINKAPVVDISHTNNADLETTQIEATRAPLNTDVQVTRGKNTVLTPMPDDAANNAIALPRLIAVMPDAIEPEASSSKSIMEDKLKTLSEDELLSKTESVYKKMPKSVVIIENSTTELSALPAPEEEKIAEIVVEESKEPPPPIKEIPKSPAKAASNVNNESPVILKKTSKLAKKYAWTVRAAQSGKAVVYDKNSKEMKSVEINDTLSGIGRIKSIQLKNGRWVITGTKGKILQ
ncbi:MAG: hypothetical protein COB36_07200 [Alphaproteobacteria bacterium]|nr:MAG: hypothetical protein COB36_07200 [Alphaproteobacteria bacterium]